MMKSWQLQEAKAQLSQVVKEAMNDGPQEISLRGQPAVVMISKRAYDDLLKPKQTFVQFMRESPWVGVDIQLTRDASLTRDIDL
jgi:antitoxin Phd